MAESLKIILEETMSVYRLGTLDGRLFIPFAVCTLYILLSPSREEDRARQYLVYPSLILCVFIFNPVFIHYMIKIMGDPERVVRVFWPLPIGGVFVYCVIRAFYALRERWKKAVLLVAAVATLLLISNGNVAGISFQRAQNPEKLIPGAKQVCDRIYDYAGERETRVLMPKTLFFWTREYNARILLPYQHKTEFMYNDDGILDLDVTGQKAREEDCEFVVISTATDSVGALEDYGYSYVLFAEGDNCKYLIYHYDAYEG